MSEHLIKKLQMKNRSERADSFSDISHQIEKIAKKRNRKHI